MNFQEYVLVFKRRMKLFCTILGVALILAILLGALTPKKYETTMHLTFALEDFQVSEDYRYSNFYAMQSALEFSRTISGWFKDPAFEEHIFRVAKVEKKGQATVLTKLLGFFSTSRVERQNLRISFETTDEKIAESLRQSVTKVINHRLEAYNIASKSTYKIAYESHYGEEQKAPWLFLLIGSIFFGIVFGFFAIFGLEFQKGLAMSVWKVSQLLKKPAFDHFSLKNTADQRLFRMRMLEEKPYKSFLLLGGESSFLNSFEGEKYHFPSDVVKLKHADGPILVVVQIGKTLEKDITRAEQFLNQLALFEVNDEGEITSEVSCEWDYIIVY